MSDQEHHLRTIIETLERENAALRADKEVFLIALYDCIKYANCGETGNIEPRVCRAIDAARKEAK